MTPSRSPHGFRVRENVHRHRRVGQLASLIFKPQAKLWRPMIAVSTAAKKGAIK
jgi:hypothetical protein